MLLTTKGVFRFDPDTKELYLAQIHPKVRIEDIKKNVPWDLKISPDLTETAHPTEEEINFVEEVCPGSGGGKEVDDRARHYNT